MDFTETRMTLGRGDDVCEKQCGRKCENDNDTAQSLHWTGERASDFTALFCFNCLGDACLILEIPI